MRNIAENRSKLINLAYLVDLAEGNQQFINEIIEMFIRDLPDAVEQMQKYCDNKEWDRLKAVAHKMKPSLSFIGLTNFQKEIQKIETSAAERAGLDKLPAIILKSQWVVQQVVEELKAELSEAVS